MVAWPWNESTLEPRHYTCSKRSILLSLLDLRTYPQSAFSLKGPMVFMQAVRSIACILGLRVIVSGGFVRRDFLRS